MSKKEIREDIGTEVLEIKEDIGGTTVTAEDRKDFKNVKTELQKEGYVKIKIPKDPLNRGNTYIPVCINGYVYQVKVGETAEVPKTVADILSESGYI